MNDAETIDRGWTVLVVDDDELFRESVAENLLDAGFDSLSFANGTALLDHLETGGQADLILLDWKMPNMRGIEVLRVIRDRGIKVPVIFLTALTDQIFEEAAFASGAVDFVEKTRSFTILLRRIELILAGAKGREMIESLSTGGAELRVGALNVCRDSHRVFWRGELVELTLAEFMIVEKLAASAGRDMRYREVYDIVRGEGFIAGDGPEGYRANVRTFIKRIRQKFRSRDDSFDEIQNYPGYGYRWRDPADAIVGVN